MVLVRWIVYHEVELDRLESPCRSDAEKLARAIHPSAQGIRLQSVLSQEAGGPPDPAPRGLIDDDDDGA